MTIKEYKNIKNTYNKCNILYIFMKYYLNNTKDAENMRTTTIPWDNLNKEHIIILNNIINIYRKKFTSYLSNDTTYLNKVINNKNRKVFIDYISIRL